MIPITHLRGDATNPIGPGQKIIVHCCNDIGGWGAGFVLALSRRWSEPETNYRAWASGELTEPPFALGSLQIVKVATGTYVANLIGQKGTGFARGIPPIRYAAIAQGLTSLAVRAKEMSASVHMPKMGAGLAGGDWEAIEQIVRDTLSASDIPVFVYTF